MLIISRYRANFIQNKATNHLIGETMIKNILLAVALTLGTATLFAPRGDKGRRSPTKKSTSPTSPSKSSLELQIHSLKDEIESPALSPRVRAEKQRELNTLRHIWKNL